MGDTNTRGRVTSIMGMLLLAVGVGFLIMQVLGLNVINFLWPFFVILPGVLFFVGMVMGGKRTGSLAIPGSIVTMVGLILLYQNTFNHFESWAYAWALVFPTAVGAGLAVFGAWSDIPRLVRQGLRWASVGLVLFLVGGFFFELVINISGSAFNRVIWPLLLIAFGVYLALRGGQRGRPADQPAASPEDAGAAARPIEVTPEKKPEFEPLDMTRAGRK